MTPSDLLDETRLLFHALKQWSETLLAESRLTAAMRGVLELILLGGPSTVPGMARARGMSRRSSLIALTDKGHALIQNMRADELNALSRMQVGVSDNAMLDAAQVLSAWRVALQRDTGTRL
ncbi:MAG: hypothetical protein JRF54_10685 [Deltaproteobacteria bacterium]|nr:hypothetical protein [Deltaproteobacteria bacterium]